MIALSVICAGLIPALLLYSVKLFPVMMAVSLSLKAFVLLIVKSTLLPLANLVLLIASISLVMPLILLFLLTVVLLGTFSSINVLLTLLNPFRPKRALSSVGAATGKALLMPVILRSRDRAAQLPT